MLGYSLTDRDLINLIQYNLVEGVISVWAGGWIGTDQFTLDDVTLAIQRRRDQFLLETGLVQSRSLIAGPAPNGSGRVVLNDSIIDVRRVAWKDASTNIFTTLFSNDEYLANSLIRTWSANPATPKVYSTILQPHVGLQTIPPNNTVGSLELVSVNAGSAFTPNASATLLGVPDDFAWVVRFGALADLLNKDGQARDGSRVEYCEQRWQEGVQLAQMFPSVQLHQINGVDSFPVSLFDLDTLRASWQNQSGLPTNLGVAGRNLIALTPTPDAVYSVTLDILRNAPVTSPLEIGREEYEVILGYAEHLARFKEGADDIQETTPLYKNLMMLASEHNDRLRAQAKEFPSLQEPAKREERQRPRREEAAA
jgi:hypothetical protein